MITTPWTKFFYEYLLEDEQDLSVGEMLTVYFGTPNMFITLWFGFDYGTNSPLGTLSYNKFIFVHAFGSVVFM
jgi:hypothetical protein